jgi:VPDSG-CTERM motif
MTTRKHAFYGILALVSLLGLGITQSAKANYIVTLQQVGSDVVATGMGAIDLTGLFQGGSNSGLVPQIHQSLVITGASESATAYIHLGPFSGGPMTWGSGPGGNATSGSGDLVGFSTGGILIVPEGYVSDTLLSDSATYSGMSFASLGLTPGTYEWFWGTGTDQNFTLQILGPSSVPDAGSTLSLLGFASLGLVALRRKLRC